MVEDRLNKIEFCDIVKIDKMLKSYKDNVVVIIDHSIVKYFSYFFKENKIKYIVVANKSIDTLMSVIKELVYIKADKSTVLVGMGGGQVTDLTGFVSSIYMRGLKCIYIPTTLLSMVDAAIGGKNAIEYNNIKNLLGTIRQVDNVYICSNLLNTLNENEWNDGYIEILKIALLRDKELLELLCNNKDTLKNNYKLLNDIIKRAVLLKLQIVEEDEYDNGVRNMLNFGHTIGHLLELTYNLSHGEAVLTGILYESRIARCLDLIDDKNLNDTINYVSLFTKKHIEYSFDDCIKYIYLDKKNRKGVIKFTYLKAIGEGCLIDLSLEKLIELLNNKNI